MLATLQAKLIAAAACLALVAGVGLAGYAMYAHMKAQAANIETLTADVAREKENTAAAVQAASAVSAALDARANAQAVAQARTQSTTRALAVAVAASPEVASQVVPESYWQAIYGIPTQ